MSRWLLLSVALMVSAYGCVSQREFYELKAEVQRLKETTRSTKELEAEAKEALGIALNNVERCTSNRAEINRLYAKTDHAIKKWAECYDKLIAALNNRFEPLETFVNAVVESTRDLSERNTYKQDL